MIQDNALKVLYITLLSRINKQLDNFQDDEELEPDTLKYYKRGYIRINTTKQIEEVKIDIGYRYRANIKSTPLRVRFTHTIPDGKISSTQLFPVPTTRLATMEDVYVLFKIDGKYGKIPITISDNYACSITGIELGVIIDLDKGGEDVSHLHVALKDSRIVIWGEDTCISPRKHDLCVSYDSRIYSPSSEYSIVDTRSKNAIYIKCYYPFYVRALTHNIPIFNLDYTNLLLTYYHLAWENMLQE